MPRDQVDALVIGAGAAGLAAAAELSRAEKRVVVLEARSRIGGRILTHHDPLSPAPIELGAEFVHGETAGTMDVIRAAGLRVDELPDEHVLSRNGTLKPLGDFWELVDRMGRDLAALRKRRSGDFPVSEYLERSAMPPLRRALLRGFVEGFHAAHPEKISAHSLAASGDGDESENRQFRVAEGYGAVVDFLRGSLDPGRVDVRTGTVAKAVWWKKGDVVVDAVNAAGATLEPFRARSAVIAIPHAVLRGKWLRFEPPLRDKERAAGRLEIGQIFKIVLRFRERFWEKDGRRPNFIHAQGVDVPVWWTAQPAQSLALTGWAGGPKAEALLGMDERARVERSLASLSRIFAVPRAVLDEGLRSWNHHDWSADPFSRGAYSYVGVGGVPAQKALARPVEGTLFFAGDALDPEDIGTVAAALKTGRRAGQDAARA